MTFDSYSLEKDSVVPGRILTRFPDGSCREAWPVELRLAEVESQLESILELLETKKEAVISQPVSSKVNLNTATLPELESVTGIGEVTAKKIIQLREDSPFLSLDEFKTRLDLSSTATAKILNKVEV
ncbi:ComEA family DNA-binding protein [Prochlorothrix hollandica]|uniref:ComEA family DNA-binding protein n=1 Tax=Prochlorothrix hollandica TaxID=1223 RepID=UPI0033408418